MSWPNIGLKNSSSRSSSGRSDFYAMYFCRHILLAFIYLAKLAGLMVYLDTQLMTIAPLQDWQCNFAAIASSLIISLF